MAANVFLVAHVALGLVFAFLGLYVFTLGVGGASVIFGLLLLGVGLASTLMGYGFFRLRRWLLRGGTLTALGYIVGGVLLIRASDVIIAIGALAIILAVSTLVYLRMKDFRAILTS
ncbi:MAG: hypothetical protein OK404_00640 [Thaumarchaeota archaeon]|nr:hypothetical protein [Nitrososphaerota archaeon]